MGITNELSLALQQKDQNIVLVMRLIKIMRARLQDFKEIGWEEFMKKVSSLCEENLILISNMEDNMRIRGQFRLWVSHYSFSPLSV